MSHWLGDSMFHRTVFVLLLAIPAVRAEDALPPGAIARLGSYRFYHGIYIEAIAVSPDGKWLATAGMVPTDGADGRGSAVHVWDAATGDLLRTFPLPEAVETIGAL